MSHILITGGSGLIGRYLIPRLQENGHSVAILTRGKEGEHQGIRYFHWNVKSQEIEPAALQGVDIIIHLAGANLAGGRWRMKRKQEIIDSRVKSAELLFKTVQQIGVPPGTFISSSAVGYYGAVTSEHIFEENDPPADDFLGTVCRLWEEAADHFLELNVRVVKLRTGVVLTRKGGALRKMLTPVKFGLGCPLGSGNQYLPWIHIDDLVSIYIKAIDWEQFQGAYNAVAPEQITNANLMRIIANALDRPFFLPSVPAFLLKLMFGEMAVTLLEGSRISAQKIQETGYEFKFPNFEAAIKNLL